MFLLKIFVQGVALRETFIDNFQEGMTDVGGCICVVGGYICVVGGYIALTSVVGFCLPYETDL